MLALLLAVAVGQFTPIPLSDGGALALDDLGVTVDGRFLIPEAELGTVLLLAPDGGISTMETGARGRRTIGSALLGGTAGELLIAGDRSQRDLLVVGDDRIVTVPLAGGPDYVRATGNEIWVTEPGKDQIEILGITTKPLTVRPLTTIAVPGGPETLAIDGASGEAYTFSEERGRLLRIDVAKHVQTADWQLQCKGKPKGLATSFGEGLAFVGCSGGLALTVSLRDGHQISKLGVGEGVDIIAFDSQRRRLYVPAGKSANLTIASVGHDGALHKLRTLPTAPHAHCVAVQQGIVLVCDPVHGRVLRLDDSR